MSLINKIKFLSRQVILLLVTSSALVWLPADAAMVGTSQLLNSQINQLPALAEIPVIRASLTEQLQTAGVSAIDAQQRVALLTDQQVVEIQQGFEETPAGAGAGGVLVTILLVLLITDLVGYTDVFPFVRPLER